MGAFSDVLTRDTRTQTNLDHAINVLFREKEKVESMLEASKQVKPKNTKAIYELKKERTGTNVFFKKGDLDNEKVFI